MSLKEDFRHALRLQIKRPRFAILVILTLGLGIGANTAIFSVVNAVILRQLPYHDPGQLIILLEHDRNVGGTSVAYPNFLDWREMSRSLEDLACYRSLNNVIIGQAGAERVSCKWVSARFFTVLGENLQLGRDFSAEEDSVGAPPSAIIGQEVWRRYFGGRQDVIGRTLNIAGVSHRVIGVTRPNFRFAGQTDLFLPIHPLAYQELRLNHDALYVVGRMKPEVTIEKADAEMQVIAKQLERQYPEENSGRTIDVIPLNQWFTGNLREVSAMLFGAVGLVLLLACVNVAGLFLARLGERRREFAVRAALGADRRKLIRLNLVEGLVLSIQGGAVGLLLAGPFLKTLTVFVASEQLEAVRIDERVVAFALAISCLTAVAFGLFPALTAAHVELNQSLRDRERSISAGHHRLRDALIVCQVALALVLLIGSALMIRTAWTLVTTETGIRPEGVVTMQVQGPESRFTKASQTASGFDIDKYATLWKNYDKEILERVQSLPGVESAATTFPLLFTGTSAQLGVQLEGEQDQSQAKALHRYSVSPDYFKVMGIRLVKGRTFTMADDWRKPIVAILNETAARVCSPDRDPIGRRFFEPLLKDFGPFTIVGVVSDTLHSDLNTPPPPQIYVSFLQWPSEIILTIRTPLDPGSIANAVRREVALFDKEAPVYNVRLMTDYLADARAYSRRMTIALAVLAGLALVLASVGIYGVMTQIVVQRTREIGVRIAVGASPAGVLRMIIGKSILLTAIGAGFGLLGALAFARVLQKWLVGVTSTDPLTYGVVSVLLVLVALAATYWPARRAASTDPITALRCD